MVHFLKYCLKFEEGLHVSVAVENVKLTKKDNLKKKVLMTLAKYMANGHWW